MGDLVQMNCPTCGGKLEIQKNAKSAVCQYCGNEHLIKPTESDIPLDTYAKCPLCKKDDKVEKVSALIRRNTEKSANKSEYQLSELARRMAPPDQPKFVLELNKQKIDKPRKKYLEKNYNQVGSTVVAIGIFVLILLLCKLAMPSPGFFPEIIFFLLSLGSIVWGIGLIRAGEKRRKIDKEEFVLKYIEYKKKNEKIQEEYDKRLEGVIAENKKTMLPWNNALKRWEKLYYCYRDDCVFIPGEGSYSHLSEIKDYIYQT